MKNFKDFLQESSLSRIYRQYKEHDSGTISAFRGNFTKDENLDRSRKLKQILENKGYSVTKINGTYIENYGKKSARPVREESYIVVDINDDGNLEKTLRSLGEQFCKIQLHFQAKMANII